jgi:peptidoglycan/LPS O-acetylase OafA/YrhL
MVFGPSWWLRPDERADIGTPPLVLVQAVLAAGSLSQLRESGTSWLPLLVGGFFALLTLRNCLRLLRGRPTARTGMVVSLGACALLLCLFAAGPLLEAQDKLGGLLLLPPLAVLLAALAQETVRTIDQRVNLKDA